MSAFRLLKDILSHPANRGTRVRSLCRAVAWQLSKRISGQPWDIDYHGKLFRCFPNNHSASRAIYFSNLPDFREMQFMRHFLRPGDRFIDAGANAGLYTILALSLVGQEGQVDAFEPNSTLAGRLREIIEANRLANVRVHEIGLGDTDGWASFAETGDDCTAHIALDGGNRIPVARLDSVLEKADYAMASHENATPFELNRVKAKVFWLGRTPLSKGRPYKLKLATQEVECEVTKIENVVDASSLLRKSESDECLELRRHQIAVVSFRFKRVVAFDLHEYLQATGRLVVVDGFDVSGGGIVVDDNYPHRTSDSTHKSTNIYWIEGNVTVEQREHRNGHVGCVIWLTGLSGAGKSTIAMELERVLFAQGKHVYVLDGDKVRHGLNSDLAFSPEDRKENIRRVGEVAKLMADAGMITVAAFISPYRSDRELVRKIMPVGRFVEVHVHAPLNVLEERDPKGLYAKARAGEIKHFTGISAPYEEPERPEVALNTADQSLDECVESVVTYLGLLERRR